MDVAETAINKLIVEALQPVIARIAALEVAPGGLSQVALQPLLVRIAALEDAPVSTGTALTGPEKITLQKAAVLVAEFERLAARLLNPKPVILDGV